MAERPYMECGIGELEQLALVGEHDFNLREALIVELSHRNIKRARRLRERLEVARTISITESAVMLRQAGGTGSDTFPGGSQPSSNETQQGRRGVLEEKYEVLRATFTYEGELLARWGMTPALPHDMQEQMFDEWQKRFVGAQHSAGELSVLAADRARLAEERAFADNSAAKRGKPVSESPEEENQ